MAVAHFQFELVSPEKLLVGKPAAMVTVPGGEGDFGVLAGHAPLIATIRPGVIEIYEQEGSAPTDRLFVAGGFAEVSADRCTVLAEEAVPLASLDRAKLDGDAKLIIEDIALAKTAHEREALQHRLTVVQAKLQVAA